MEAVVKKWGNSLGIRLPKNLSNESGIVENTTVQMHFEEGRIVIEPILKEATLADLMELVTDANKHDEVLHDRIGGEEW